MKHRRQVPQHPSFVQWDQGAFRDDRWRPADLSPPLVSATPCRRRRGVLSAQDMTLNSASTDKSALARIQENQHHLRTAKPKISQPSSPLPAVPMAGTSLGLGFGPAGGDSTFFSTPGFSTGHCRSRRQVFAERLIARISSGLLSHVFAAPSTCLFARNISVRWLFSAGRCCCHSKWLFLRFSLRPGGSLPYSFIYPLFSSVRHLVAVGALLRFPHHVTALLPRLRRCRRTMSRRVGCRTEPRFEPCWAPRLHILGLLPARGHPCRVRCKCQCRYHEGFVKTWTTDLHQIPRGVDAEEWLRMRYLAMHVPLLPRCSI